MTALCVGPIVYRLWGNKIMMKMEDCWVKQKKPLIKVRGFALSMPENLGDNYGLPQANPQAQRRLNQVAVQGHDP